MYGKRKRSSSHGRKSVKRHKGARGWSNRLSTPGYFRSSRSRPAFSGPSFSFFDGRLNQPDGIRIKIKTYVSAVFTSTSGLLNSTSIKLNSIYQPFHSLSSSTHQNPTLGNLSTLYGRYRVLYASLTLTMSPETAALSPQPHWVALGSWDNTVDTVNITQANQMVEGKHCKFTYVPAQAGFSHPIKLHMGMNMAELVGLSSRQYVMDNHFEGVIANTTVPTDPPQVLSIWVAHQSADASSTNAISVDMVLTQYLQFYGRAPYG